MARIRTIKPEFWSDDRILELSPLARLLFIGTWNFADDAGNIDRSSKQLKARIFPGDLVEVELLVLEILGQDLMVEYSVEGKVYLHIRNFDRHQRINRPSTPTCPPFPASFTEPSLSPHGVPHEESLPEGKGKEGKGKEGKGEKILGSDHESGGERKRFVAPTLEEVGAYCLERRNNVDPQRFMDHYQSNGWMVGKNRMKDWKAAVRTWEKNDCQRGSGKRSQLPGLSGIRHDAGIAADGRF